MESSDETVTADMLRDARYIKQLLFDLCLSSKHTQLDTDIFTLQYSNTGVW